MRTVLWDRVRGVASGLPIPFIGRERVSTPADGQDQLDQALRQVVQEREVEQEREVLEEPLLQSTSAGRSDLIQGKEALDNALRPSSRSIPWKVMLRSDVILWSSLQS